jgi:hypothetical protein
MNYSTNNSGKFGWEQRYAASDDLFGQTPSKLLLNWRNQFSAGQSALAVGAGKLYVLRD